MTELNLTQCAACDRLRGYTCAAYPDGIIDHFLIEGGDHRQPYPGDHGFQFVQKDTAEARQAFELWQNFWGASDDSVRAQARAAGHDTTPGRDQLHHYWTRGEGLAKWVGSPTPWTTLRDHLLKYLPPGEATKAASKWFEEVFGFAAGSDLNRITHGQPPRGHKVGPG